MFRGGECRAPAASDLENRKPMMVLIGSAASTGRGAAYCAKGLRALSAHYPLLWRLRSRPRAGASQGLPKLRARAPAASRGMALYGRPSACCSAAERFSGVHFYQPGATLCNSIMLHPMCSIRFPAPSPLLISAALHSPAPAACPSGTHSHAPRPTWCCRRRRRCGLPPALG